MTRKLILEKCSCPFKSYAICQIRMIVTCNAIIFFIPINIIRIGIITILISVMQITIYII